jgi:Protein of unknown function (DUF1353)
MSRHLLLLLCLAQFTGCGSCISTVPAPPVPPPIPPAPFGRFDGQVIAAWDDDGRFMTLNDKFTYIDASNKAWLAPAGAHVNGASIPEAFWSIIGGPFEGQYRNASVVHDVYCETMSEPWEAVHEMFYQACRCGGVEEPKAKMLYWAVYHFGPRWETPMPFATGSKSKSSDPHIAFAPTRFTAKTADESTATAAAEYFQTHNPTLDEIKHLDIAPP